MYYLFRWDWLHNNVLLVIYYYDLNLFTRAVDFKTKLGLQCDGPQSAITDTFNITKYPNFGVDNLHCSPKILLIVILIHCFSNYGSWDQQLNVLIALNVCTYIILSNQFVLLWSKILNRKGFQWGQIPSQFFSTLVSHLIYYCSQSTLLCKYYKTLPHKVEMKIQDAFQVCSAMKLHILETAKSESHCTFFMD
jgi:hypothetical protein